MAEESGLSLSTVRKVEQGGHVSMDTLASLAAALGVSTSDLFAGEAPQPVLGQQDEANRRQEPYTRPGRLPQPGQRASTVRDPAPTRITSPSSCTGTTLISGADRKSSSSNWSSASRTAQNHQPERRRHRPFPDDPGRCSGEINGHREQAHHRSWTRTDPARPGVRSPPPAGTRLD
ncbi:helix-turn-helix domain-containing protein [Streptomyces sp. NPDC002669]|uniref:helix-turn-helix domain-containing protein n=1 Tax=Streptomyces sp. NPDC002669 TaxID=3364658 RepID=UPI0036C4D90D